MNFAYGHVLWLLLVIPPLFTDSDQRSLSDLATKTAVVRR